MSGESSWLTYYQSLEGRAPRALLARVLALFESDATPNTPRQAIDLGCGDGTETRALIEQGWSVLAIDREPEAKHFVERKIPASKRGALQMQIASFEEARLVPADLIYAGFSLPFCSPQNFDGVWRNLTEATQPGGRFAGHLFGERDTWASDPEMTFFTRPAAEGLFEGFELEFFDETENDGSALGRPKHWHVFEVIARKLVQ